jgi:hypothetical protein
MDAFNKKMEEKQMKKCVNASCGKMIPDENLFCESCGTRQVIADNSREQASASVTTTSASSFASMFSKPWFPLVLAVVSFIVAWYFSAWLGFGIGGASIYYAYRMYKSDKKGIHVLSIILAVISMAISIWAMT